MNLQESLIQSKRLRALLWLAESNQEAIAAGPPMPTIGLSRRVLHAAGIDDNLLKALAADGWLRHAAPARNAESAKRHATQRGKRAAIADAQVVLTAEGAAVLEVWLASGPSFPIPQSIIGLECAPQWAKQSAGLGPAANCDDLAGSLLQGGFVEPVGPGRVLVTLPTWDEKSGKVCLATECVLPLSKQAVVERRFISELHRAGWFIEVVDPHPAPAHGQSRRLWVHDANRRRNAIRNLNAHQQNRRLGFASTGQRRLVCFLRGASPGHVCISPIP